MNTIRTSTKQDQILQLLGQLKHLIEENPEITNDSPLTESALGQGFAEVEVIARPLSRHHLADSDEHTRQHYATLLATFLLTNGPLSPDISRLFGMLLQSLNLAGQQVNIMTHASRIQSADVVEYTRLAQKTPRLPQCLLMDALVIMRVDGNQLPKTWEDILNEWISVCKINQQNVSYCIEFSDLILGNKSIGNIEKNLKVQLKSIEPENHAISIIIKKENLNMKPGAIYTKGDILIKIDRLKLEIPENLIITSTSEKDTPKLGTHWMSSIHYTNTITAEIKINYLPLLPEISAWKTELKEIL